MTTRIEYRTNLTNKLLALEDGSYGDFEYSTSELDTFLDLATLRLFPAVYDIDSATGLSITGYGTVDQGYVTDASINYSRVYLVEDADELDALVGWETRPGKIIGIDTSLYSTVNVYWTVPFTLPSADLDEGTISAEFEPLINLGALIEALEARQDIGIRGEPGSGGRHDFFETELLDRLRPRYDALKTELSMALPGSRH